MIFIFTSLLRPISHCNYLSHRLRVAVPRTLGSHGLVTFSGPSGPVCWDPHHHWPYLLRMMATRNTSQQLATIHRPVYKKWVSSLINQPNSEVVECHPSLLQGPMSRRVLFLLAYFLSIIDVYCMFWPLPSATLHARFQLHPGVGTWQVGWTFEILAQVGNEAITSWYACSTLSNMSITYVIT